MIGESLLVLLLGATSIGMPELFPNIGPYVVISFIIVLLYLIGPINGILNAVPHLVQIRIAWNRIQTFIQQIPANIGSDELSSSKLVKVDRIEVRGIKYQFKNERGDKEGFSLGPINLELSKGEILFIVGGNGSGKTTLAKLLVGLYEPDEGELMINDQIVENSQVSEYFSAVFSPHYLFEKLYIDTETKETDLKKYLKLLDLNDKIVVLDDKYSTLNLSGGKKKRLALLQCFLEDSPIYLFDEWAADQDPHYRNFFYRTLLPEMKQSGKIVIAITHDDHYFDVADRVMKMEGGKLEAYALENLWRQ